MKKETREVQLLKFFISTVIILFIHCISMMFLSTTLILWVYGSKLSIISSVFAILYYFLSFFAFIKLNNRRSS